MKPQPFQLFSKFNFSSQADISAPIGKLWFPLANQRAQETLSGFNGSKGNFTCNLQWVIQMNARGITNLEGASKSKCYKVIIMTFLDIQGHCWRCYSIKINCAKEKLIIIFFFQNKKWYCHKDEEDMHPLNSKLKACNHLDYDLI